MDISTVDPLALPSVALSDRKTLPECQGIYFVITSDGIILYIGKAVDVRRRWHNHHRRHDFTDLKGARIAWLQFDGDAALLDDIERACIDCFAPVLNGTVRAIGPINRNKPYCPFRVRQVAEARGFTLSRLYEAIGTRRIERGRPFPAMITLRRFWHSTDDGRVNGRPLNMFSLEVIEELAHILNVEIRELLPEEV